MKIDTLSFFVLYSSNIIIALHSYVPYTRWLISSSRSPSSISMTGTSTIV